MIEVRINIFVHEHNNHNSQKGFFLNTKNLMFFTKIESGCFSGIISLSVGDKKESSSLMKINKKNKLQIIH